MAEAHLLFALLHHEVAWRAKLPPPCRRELRAFVEQELDRIPAENAYRDAATPVLAKNVVDAIRPSRWSLFERPLGPRDLMNKLAMLPRVRDWLSWASMDDLLVDEAVDEASSLATQRNHFTVKVLHFLRVISEQHWLGAPSALMDLLDQHLDELVTPGRTDKPTLSEDLAVLVAKAKVYARMAQRPATSDMLLAIALREDETRRYFEGVGVDVDALLQRLAHDAADLPPAPTTGMVDVVLHGDDFTPVELVKELLEAKFHLASSASKTAIATSHDEGEVVVATLPSDEALLRAEEARTRAREARVPLRITLRAAT